MIISMVYAHCVRSGNVYLWPNILELSPSGLLRHEFVVYRDGRVFREGTSALRPSFYADKVIAKKP